MLRQAELPFDGLRIPIEVWGEADRPLIFLPGLGAHPIYYREGLRRLARHLTVFIPDLSFRTHGRLPEGVAGYRALAEELAARYAPEAPRAGHSFGGFLALLGTRPAIALAPTVPIPAGWTAQVTRAAALQLREYLGLEGRRAIGWAWGIMCDYVGTALSRPRCLFPAVTEILRTTAERYPPTAPSGLVLLATHDHLYRRRESDAYLAILPAGAFSVRTVDHGHDWPVSHPELLERELLAALGEPVREERWKELSSRSAGRGRAPGRRARLLADGERDREAPEALLDAGVGQVAPAPELHSEIEDGPSPGHSYPRTEPEGRLGELRRSAREER
ncbi:MAG: alpha/beta fold hydrolase [Gemmatimonadota bacterium]